jgi:hypothetical protein
MRRGRIRADVEDKPPAQEDGESPHLPLPAQAGSRKRKPLVRGLESLSNLSMLDATDELTGVDFIDGLTYSDHEHFNNVISAALHALAAKKILSNPQLIEEAQVILERWISKQTPTPRPLLEWRRILARTPQDIAAVAMSLTSEATRLRSSSPLCFVLSHGERAAVYALFGKNLRLLAELREELRAVARGERRVSPKPKTTVKGRVAAVRERARRRKGG